MGGDGRERERKGVDEIEMELPEGTDGPAGFRTRRKIKTRPNGCEGKFYYATFPSPAFAELCAGRTGGVPIPEYLKAFRTKFGMIRF